MAVRINFKRLFQQSNLRQKLWAEYVEKTEKEIGGPIPNWIKDKINEALNKYESMQTDRQFFAYLLANIKDCHEILKRFVSHSIQLNPNCQYFLKSVIEECYNATNNEGIRRRLWKYMNQIDIMDKEVQYFEKINISNLDKEAVIYEFLTFYERIYEITIKILSEYAFMIAKSKYTTNKKSKEYVDQYEKLSRDGRTVNRETLKKFFEELGFWVYGKNCPVLESKLRNAVAHFNFYPSKNLIMINNESMTIDELKVHYIQLMSFYSYIVGESMKKSKWFDLTTDMEKFLSNKLLKRRIFKLVYVYANQFRKYSDKFDFGP